MPEAGPSQVQSTSDASVRNGIVIVEDAKLLAELFGIHCTNLGLEVLRICETGLEGLEAIRQYKPALVLIDISLPDGDGLELAKLVSIENPTTRIIATSSHRDPWTMLRVQRSDIHGYVDKNEPAEILSEAIREVTEGRVYLPPRITEATNKLKKNAHAFHRVLSDREIKILSMFGACETDESIATKLGLSQWTVQSRRRDILRKLNLHSTPALIRYAIVNGLTRVDHWDHKGNIALNSIQTRASFETPVTTRTTLEAHAKTEALVRSAQ